MIFQFIPVVVVVVMMMMSMMTTTTTTAFTAIPIVVHRPIVSSMMTNTNIINKTPEQRLVVVVFMGYLDEISRNELYDDRGDPNPNPQEESRHATRMDKDKVQNYGPTDFTQFVDFNEFDGGDGQMGVAGDGKQGLDKEWEGAAQMAKSKSMSARVAWGKSTGYADELIAQGMEQSRAQQLENWQNQREVQEQRNYQRYMTDVFDNNQKTDDDWRKLSSFSGELVQQDDTDLDQQLGMVQIGSTITGIIELQARINQASTYEFTIKNPFMGFSNFRARFVQMNQPMDWTITPTDGSLNGRGDPTSFLVKFRPQSPSTSTGYLVIETEDDKWTYQLLGTASM